MIRLPTASTNCPSPGSEQYPHFKDWTDRYKYLRYKDRMRPTAAIPVTDVPDAVAEIERCARAGLGAILLPERPPVPYWSRHYDPIWAAAQANGMPVFFHVATGGVSVKEETSETAVTVKGLMMAVNMGKGQLTDDMVAGRLWVAAIPPRRSRRASSPT
ncbi:amidohydrolase family protein [Nocardia sp. NPDC050408]|uniref:amidohydrolase family protein n=1 Tax=unclassified Nocardia TaxID=2637762 RepID=UPI0034498249